MPRFATVARLIATTALAWGVAFSAVYAAAEFPVTAVEATP